VIGVADAGSDDHGSNAVDTIVVPDAVTWTEVSYHGETSLLGTFDGGNSSVLLIGVTGAEQGQVAVQTDPGLLGLG